VTTGAGAGRNQVGKAPCRPIPHERLDPMEAEFKKRFGVRQRPRLSIKRWYYPHGAHNVSDGGAGLLTPLFITDVLGGNVGHVGLVTAAGSLASVPASVGWGELSDQAQRRRPFIVAGYLGAGALLVLMGLCGSLELFIGLSVALGVMSACSHAVSTLIVTENTEEKRWTRELSAYIWLGSVGGILGLLAGAVWMEVAGWAYPHGMSMRSLFVLLGITSIVAGLAAGRMVPEAPAKPFAPRKIDRLIILRGRLMEKTRFLPLWMYRLKYRRGGSLHRIRKATVSVPSALRWYYLSVFLLYAGTQTVFTPFPIFLSESAMFPDPYIFAIYLFNSAASTALYFRAGEWISRLGEKKVLTSVNALRCALFAGFGAIALMLCPGMGFSLAVLQSLLLLLMVGSGLLWAFMMLASTALVSRRAPPATKGENMGIFQAVVYASAILGALAGGGIALLSGYGPVFFFGAAMVGAGVLMLLANKGLDGAVENNHDKEWHEPA